MFIRYTPKILLQSLCEKIVNDMLREKFRENVKKFPSDKWNKILEKLVKINIYQNKVWGRNKIYTRALSIECPKVIKNQIKRKQQLAF